MYTTAKVHPSTTMCSPTSLHTTLVATLAAAFELYAKPAHTCHCANAMPQCNVSASYTIYKTVAVHLRPMICCPTTPRNTPLATLAAANVPPRPMCQTTQLLPRCRCYSRCCRCYSRCSCPPAPHRLTWFACFPQCCMLSPHHAALAHGLSLLSSPHSHSAPPPQMPPHRP